MTEYAPEPREPQAQLLNNEDRLTNVTWTDSLEADVVFAMWNAVQCFALFKRIEVSRRLGFLV